MKFTELTYSDTLEINGGSVASNDFWYGVGLCLGGMWELVCAGGGSYSYGKCG